MAVYNDMNWLLKWRLRRLSAKADPSREFVASLETRLKTLSGHKAWWIRPGQIAMSLGSIVMLTGAGTGVYAYSSDSVVPDHPLYVLRQGIEHVEETMAVTNATKERVHQKFVRRRMHEAEIVQQTKGTKTPEVIRSKSKELRDQMKEQK